MKRITSTPFENISGFPAQVARHAYDYAIMDGEHLLALIDIPKIQNALARSLVINQGELVALERLLRANISPFPKHPRKIPMRGGALAPTDAIRSEIESLRVATPRSRRLPPLVNFIPQMPAIKNQGWRGTCASFAMVAVREFLAQKMGDAQDFSEQFLYYETKLIDGQSSSCGTWLVKAAGAVRARGICRERVWRYDTNPPCNNHGARPPTARHDGSRYRAKRVVYGSRSLASAKACLAQGYVLAVTIPMYASWFDSYAVRCTGNINMRLRNEPRVDGHMLCVVGYCDDTRSPGGGHLILRNSWTTTWGDSNQYGPGHGTIPYAFLLKHGEGLASLRAL